MTNHRGTPPGVPAGVGVAGVLARMRAEVRELTTTLWSARSGDELIDIATEVESIKSTFDAVLLGVVHELEVTNAVKPMGWASTQDFVTAVAGGRKSAGPAVVRLAKAVDLPVFAPLGEAMSDGWLSSAKAHVIVRAIDHLPGDVETRDRGVQVMLDAAKGLDATELGKVGRRLVETVDPDGVARKEERELDREERSAHLGRDLWLSFDGAGGFRFGGRGSAEDGTKLKTTLMALAAPRPAAGPVCDPASCDVPGCGHDGRDPRDHGARMFDALVEVCDRAATAELLPECHGATPRVSVTIHYDDLKNATGFGTTDTGEDLNAATVRRMACDAHVIPIVLGSKGEVIDVGLQQRLVTAAIWKGLVARDRHCRFPNCTRPPVMCHAHHIVHWADRGSTSLANMMLLCGHHHRLIHAGPWTIRQSGTNEFVFDPPPGTRRMSTTGREPPDG